jgi:hypothetical protein
VVQHAQLDRLWLAIAVATRWVVSVGGQAEATATCSGLEDLLQQRGCPLGCFRAEQDLTQGVDSTGETARPSRSEQVKGRSNAGDRRVELPRWLHEYIYP